ncbi:MAG: FecR domain-containing protein [Deltaproteobacteria bacterium]|nr:FecR domain-containing protein [Deltaproteobacteria bacterium]
MEPMNENPACARFLDELAASLEGELSPAAVDHLASCDACRDLRHEARTVARAVGLGGRDYQHPADFEARLLAALDARAQGRAPGAVQAPVDAVVAVPPAQTLHQAPPTVPMDALPPGLSEALAASPAAPPSPRALSPMPAPLGTTGESNVIPLVFRRPWLTSAVVAVTTLAAAAAVVVLRDGKREKPAPVVAQSATSAWEGRLAQVVRAASERRGGVELRRASTGAWEPLTEGAALARGVGLRTDPRTRARVELADGTVLVLDRGTELQLDGATPRAATLVGGNVVADVAPMAPGGSPARFRTSVGEVEVRGTRFALTATEDRANVRVTRGAVRLVGARGSDAPGTNPGAEVKTGEEGVLSRNGTVSVSPAVDLAGAVSWAELGGGREGDDPAITGIGELRARRPNSTTERESALRITSHSVKVRIVGAIARTEVEEVFQNDTDQELEGLYRFPLPPEAQIEDLSLDVNGELVAGAFVDRNRAAAIWRGVLRHASPTPPPRTTEEFVWVPGPWHDPALLEWQRGGRFELRVFPIPRRGSRRVSIAYTQTIPSAGGLRRYVYPLPHNPGGSTQVGQFDVDLQVLGHDPQRGVTARGYALGRSSQAAPTDGARLEFSQASFVPSGDLVVEYSLRDATSPLTAWAFQPTAGAAPASPAGTATPAPTPPAQPAPLANTGPEKPFVALSLRPQLPRWNDTRPRDYVFLVDASRSMFGERYTRASRLVGGMVAEMDRRDRFTVLACDTRCQGMPGASLRAPSSEEARGVGAFLQGVEPAGASDLLAQVRAALAAAPREDGRELRVVYLGDGVATAGHRRLASLSGAVQQLFAGRTGTYTTVALGNDADVPTLSALARAGGGLLVPYTPGERLASAALAVLEATYGVALRDPVVTLPEGLSAMAPARLGNFRAGSETMVYARMDRPDVSGEVVLRGTVGGEAFEARYPLALHATGAAGNAFVPRLYAAARIADLEAEGSPTAREEIVSLSQRFRVASRHTSLLVLESEAMFQAFGVTRGPATDVWTGEEGSQATTTPTAPTAPSAEAAAADSDELLGGDLARADSPMERDRLGALGATGGGAGGGFNGARGRASATHGSALRRAPMGDDGMGMGPPAARPAPTPATVAPGASPAPSMAQREQRQGGTVMAEEMPPWNRRGGRWMRRTWVRHAQVAPSTEDGGGFNARIEAARRALLSNPDSRDRHRELYRFLSLSGALEEAAEVAQRWATRDPLDPEALQRLGDVAARRGDREKAVRLLAGAVDVRPDDSALLERLALLHERAGEAEAACAYRVSLAELRGADAGALGRAARCERAAGRPELAGRVLEAAAPALRAQAEARALEPLPADTLRGEFTLDATWDAGEDLDLALIDPRGARLSWQGGRAGVTARDIQDRGREALGLSRAPTGEYLVEVVRARPGTAPVRGRVTVSLLGERRTIPFTLTGPRQRVARVAITREMVLVPVDRPPGF